MVTNLKSIGHVVSCSFLETYQRFGGNQLGTEQVGTTVKLSARILEVLGYDLGKNIGYSNRNLS
jgi:hypothetical protein